MRRMTERGGEGVQFVDFCVGHCLRLFFSSSLFLSFLLLFLVSLLLIFLRFFLFGACA